MNFVESLWDLSPDAAAPRRSHGAPGSAAPASPKRAPEGRTDRHPGHERQPATVAAAGVPAYRIHRGKGLAYVRLNKRMVYLGGANSPDSFEKYRRTRRQEVNAAVPAVQARRLHARQDRVVEV